MNRTRIASALFLLTACASPALGASFVTFESGQVRPLALSPDGTRLYAVNTPDARLETFAVAGGGITHTGSVPVGLEPVAVAARTNGEVWVVNHLSDSVSVVDVAASPPRVVRTLLVGDEPRDIVFAGPGGNRAFITTAHRGQNTGFDPELTTEGVGRADVWVFDATNLGPSLGGTPLDVVTLFGDTPRALAVSPDGGTVYAAVFHSGNQTMTVPDGAVCNGGSSAGSCNVGGVTMPGGLPAPNRNFENTTGPETGLIVKFNPSNNRWEDRLGRNWTNAVKFNLPDQDVFAINASTLAQSGVWSSVGTVLFNMVTNPVSGKVYVANTEARNEIRFEGPGTFAATVPGVPSGPKTVRGHLHEARITVLSGGTVTTRHLNKHIDYTAVPSPAGVKNNSLATPTGMAVTANGATLYVAAFGSSRVGVFSTAALENNSFTPSAASHITVSGGGPSGVVLDEANARLYVFTRFDNAISVIDTASNMEVDHLAVHNPEPPAVEDGRHVLYDAILTSSNGEASCSTCHVFGDFDSLAWDLGNPDDVVLNDPNPRRVGDPIGMSFPDFHPLKGPMATQSLRGMANHGPMHWRGDRTGGNDPGGNSLDENAAFNKFIVAFDGLLGRGSPISTEDMQAFTDFILQVTYPPNPIRALDNSLTPDQTTGRNFFLNSNPSDVFQPCNGCHRLDPAAGFFGSDGFSSFEFEPQFMKIPHLRNMYQKVGMFGMTAVSFVNPGDNGHKGDQVRGFGFLHDGSTDTVFRFHNATVFNQNNPGGFPIGNAGGFPNGAPGDPLRRQVEQFMLAFDSDLAPIVGQQITLTSSNGGTVGPRINLLIARAAANECNVIVKGTLAGEQRGWVRLASGAFQGDRNSDATLTDAQVRAHASSSGQERTYTCVPPGSGARAGIDRDLDGFYDRTEIDAGSDPADPSSTPGGPIPTTTTVTSTSTTTISTIPFVTIRTTTLKMRDFTGGSQRSVRFKSNTKGDTSAHRIVIPTLNSAADPRQGGAILRIYNTGTTSDSVTVSLPAIHWTAVGTGGSVPRQYRYRDSSAAAAISRVNLAADRLDVKGGGLTFGYTLTEPAQDTIGVRFEVGGSGWCSTAVFKSPAEKNDRPGRFNAAKTPATPQCSPIP